MRALLAFATLIDGFSRRLAYVASWAVLAVALLVSADALVSYALVWLDGLDAFLAARGVQAGFLLDWYRTNANSVTDATLMLFTIIVMLGAPWTLKVNEHVRVDLLYSMMSPRGKARLDIFGGLVFLLPMCLIMIGFTLPWALASWSSGEVGASAGGLPRWPGKMLLPIGFALLTLQAVAELIKCVAALTTDYTREHGYEKPLQ